MFADFFQTAAIPANYLTGTYDIRLVILSFMVAVAASYIALDLTGRLRDINNTRTSKLLWLFCGSIAMGSGIWTMHFIGMLSFTIPGLTLQYDAFWTGISLLVAIVASGFALYLLQAPRIRVEHYVAGGVILGFAIASMHYTGMEALLISLDFRYLPSLFFLSILIAIVASEAALWFALKSNQVVLRLRTRIKIVSAIIMGTAICGMHYTGMAASIFTPLCAPSVLTTEIKPLDPTLLSMGIAAVTFVILGVAFVTSTYKEALNQRQLEKARQLGMAEISASVLHNVGNVLNSVNVSSSIINEKISASKISDLQKICDLFNEHKNDIATFMTEDPRGMKTLDFLNALSKHLLEEQKNISDEIIRVSNNIQLIKEIISTQQDLSKTAEVEQIYAIDELLNEALLITGINIKKGIEIKKLYGKMSPAKIDKIKFIQAIVNILHNAKDAVLESSKQDKIITVKTSLSNNNIVIEISDNGIGVISKNKDKIFNYGFTTKKTGHGFGLHTSAVTINEMGGKITLESQGQEKGTLFTIEIPYHAPKS